MSRTKVNLISEGIQTILKCDGVQEILREKANEMRDRCGEGYEVSSNVGIKRANSKVYPTTIVAKRSNMKNNTLLKAVRK